MRCFLTFLKTNSVVIAPPRGDRLAEDPAWRDWLLYVRAATSSGLTLCPWPMPPPLPSTPPCPSPLSRILEKGRGNEGVSGSKSRGMVL